MKVLIVDDSESMRNIERSILIEMNIQTFEAKDGEEALDLLQVMSGFDLIVLDINMPNMNGLQTLRRLKTNKDFKNIPVIMCTNCNTKEHVSTALKLGAKNYIIKPFDTISFTRKIEQVLEQ